MFRESLNVYVVAAIGPAYPQDAGIRSWIRTVTLDRVHERVAVEEDFELENSVPIALSIMTPRVPAADGRGQMTMKLASGDGKAALLKFDGAALDPDVEKIALTDPHLREDWGDQIYRILLKSQPVAKGNWSYEFSAA